MGLYPGYDIGTALEAFLWSGTMFFTNFFGIGLGIVFYVLQSLGLYAIASRRQLKNPWLAWLPIGNMWILGSISDQYQRATTGRIRNRRKTIVALHIAIMALAVIWLFASLGSIIGSIVSMGGIDAMSEAQVWAMVVTPLLTSLGMLLILWVVVIVCGVIQYIALYDLYRSCDSKNGVLYLVLSIFFASLMGIFIFLCREKDDGMPPHKTLNPESDGQGPEF